MKRASLTTLLRLNRHQLDEKRRHIAEILREIERIEQDWGRLDQHLLAEQKDVNEGFLPGDYAAFSMKISQQKEELIQRWRETDDRMAEAQADAMETYREVKKFEKLEAELMLREKRAERLAEEMQLDEISTQKTARMASDF